MERRRFFTTEIEFWLILSVLKYVSLSQKIMLSQPDFVSNLEKKTNKHQKAVIEVSATIKIVPKRSSLIRRWTLKKIPSKNIFSSWRKIILKNNLENKSGKFSNFQRKNRFSQVKIYLGKSIFP